MKVNLQKYLKEGRNIVEWAIIHLMTVKSKNLSDIPEFNPQHYGGKLDTAAVDIEVKINGIDVDFIELIEWLHKNNGRLVAVEAKKLLDEKCSGIYDKISEFESFFADLIRREEEKIQGKHRIPTVNVIKIYRGLPEEIHSFPNDTLEGYEEATKFFKKCLTDAQCSKEQIDKAVEDGYYEMSNGNFYFITFSNVDQ